MPLVLVQPAGFRIEVQEGETIMSAATRQGYRWPTVCGGMAQCAACFVIVQSGMENLSPISRVEEGGMCHLRAQFPAGGSLVVRLACQAKPCGEVSVFKRGVRHAEP